MPVEIHWEKKTDKIEKRETFMELRPWERAMETDVMLQEPGARHRHRQVEVLI